MYTDEEMMDMWREGNNNGRGYAVGEEHHTSSEAADAEGYTDVRAITPEGCVVCRGGGGTIVICDAHGPWAVKIKEQNHV